MKKLLLFLLLIPALSKAQWTPRTLSWSFPTTQTGVLDSGRYQYAGQAAIQYIWSSAYIRNWTLSQPHIWNSNQTLNNASLTFTNASGNTSFSGGVDGFNIFDNQRNGLSYYNNGFQVFRFAAPGHGADDPLARFFVNLIWKPSGTAKFYPDSNKRLVVQIVGTGLSNIADTIPFNKLPSLSNSYTKIQVDSIANLKLNKTDTTSLARKNGNSSITNANYTALGSAGNGYYRVVSQSISPAKNASYLTIYRDSVNRFSYLNGIYRRTFAVPRSIDRTITYPYNNNNAILSDSTEVASQLNLKLAKTDTTAMLANVVHKAGAETIAGAKTLTNTLTTQSIVSSSDNTYSIGNSSFRYQIIYSNIFQANQIRNAGSNLTFFNNNSTTQIGQLVSSTGNWIFQFGGTFTDNGQKLQVGGRIRVTQGLAGTAGADSLLVHDNTSKEIKLVSANYYLPFGATDNQISKTANYTVVSGDFAAGKKTTLDIYVDATAGNVTITLPTYTSFAGYTIYVTKTDASANTVTINTIVGNNTLVSQYQVRQFNTAPSIGWVNH